MSLTRLLERLGATDVAALDVGGVSAASSTPEQFRRHVDRVVDQLAADRGLARSGRQRRSATLANGINRDTAMYWRPGLTPDRPAGQTPPWLRRRATCAETTRTVGEVA
jgi:hypothetical protein